MRLMLESRANGILFLGLFGAAWALEAGLRLSSRFEVTTILIVLVVLGLIASACFGFHKSARSQAVLTADEIVIRARSEKWLYWSMGAEGVVLFVVGGVVLPSLHLMPYVWPCVALIVGLHFLPLAYSFPLRIYYLTAVLMCLVAVIVIIGLSGGVLSLGSWDVVVGFACAAILWGTSGAVILQVLQLMRQSVAGVKT